CEPFTTLPASPDAFCQFSFVQTLKNLPRMPQLFLFGISSGSSQWLNPATDQSNGRRLPERDLDKRCLCSHPSKAVPACRDRKALGILIPPGANPVFGGAGSPGHFFVPGYLTTTCRSTE